MDKVKKHKTIARELAIEVNNMSQEPNDPIETQLILDDKRGHYLLYFSGWENNRRTYGCFFHIDVRPDGKVWVQHDGTDLVIAQLLLDRGISKQDMVIGFHSPFKRQHSDFAVA